MQIVSYGGDNFYGANLHELKPIFLGKKKLRKKKFKVPAAETERLKVNCSLDPEI